MGPASNAVSVNHDTESRLRREFQGRGRCARGRTAGGPLCPRSPPSCGQAAGIFSPAGVTPRRVGRLLTEMSQQIYQAQFLFGAKSQLGGRRGVRFWVHCLALCDHRARPRRQLGRRQLGAAPGPPVRPCGVPPHPPRLRVARLIPPASRGSAACPLRRSSNLIARGHTVLARLGRAVGCERAWLGSIADTASCGHGVLPTG